MRQATGASAPWRWLWPLLLAGFVLRVGLGLSADWVYRVDEYIQYLEQAHRLVFGYGIIPWEYRLGARNWMNAAPAIAVLWLCKAVGLGHPDYYVPAMIAAHSALSMLLPLGMYFFTRRQYNETAGRAALLFGTLWYELIIFAPRALSELYAASLIMAALGLAPSAVRAGAGRALLGGFLLGLALSLRAPYVPVAGIAGLAWLFVLPGRSRAALVGGGLAALLLWGAVDALTWGGWWSSLRNHIIVIAETPDEVWEQTGLYQKSKTEFAYLKYLAMGSFGIFPAVFIAACLAFRAHWFLLLLIGGVLLSHLLYTGAQYSNIFVVIPLWLCLAAALFGRLAARRVVAPVTAAAALVALAGYCAVLPFTEFVYRHNHRHFFFQSPFLAVSQFLSRQEDVRAVIYACSHAYSGGGYYRLHHNVPYSGGGYYRLHHNVPVLSLALPEQARLIEQSGFAPTEIASHLVVCEPEPINGFSEVFRSGKARVYARDDPAGIKPLAGFVYDIYIPAWTQIEDYVIEQGLFPNSRPPTPFAPELE